ncbi:MAG: efflux RND transporter permease subunit [Rhodospirillales bacterium]|nr:efflux RND transporter permease subunit [Rhodospirillales bacterium]
MSSTSSGFGSYSLLISFGIGTDADITAINVQNRVVIATNKLSEEVRRQGIAIQPQNIQTTAGQIGAPLIEQELQFQYSIVAQGSLTSPDEFGEIVICSDRTGADLKLRDIARIELGADTYSS